MASRIVCFVFASAFAVLAAGIYADIGPDVTLRTALYYYGIPALGFSGALLLGAASRDTRLLILVACGAAYAGGVAADMVAAYSFHDREAEQYSLFIDGHARQGKKFDGRTVLQVVKDMRKEGREVYPKISPQSLLVKTGRITRSSVLHDGKGEIVALGGIAGKTVVACNESGRHLVYQSDEYGFHNPPGIWRKPQIDIALVGDSFTEGFCVATDKNYVSYLRQEFPATLNLGMSGNGPLFELAQVREYLRVLKPRLVFWVYYEGNDLPDLVRNRENRILPRYLEPGFSQELMKRRDTVNGALRAYLTRLVGNQPRRSIAGKRGLVDFLLLRNLRSRLASVFPRMFGDKNYEAELGLMAKILRVAANEAKNWNARMVLVYLPGKNAFSSSSGARLARFRPEILAAARQAGMPVIDITEDFRKAPDPLDLFVLHGLGHYNAKGYAVTGERLRREIHRNGWLD